MSYFDKYYIKINLIKENYQWVSQCSKLYGLSRLRGLKLVDSGVFNLTFNYYKHIVRLLKKHLAF